jgi:hypothetical protein
MITEDKNKSFKLRNFLKVNVEKGIDETFEGVGRRIDEPLIRELGGNPKVSYSISRASIRSFINIKVLGKTSRELRLRRYGNQDIPPDPNAFVDLLDKYGDLVEEEMTNYLVTRLGSE